MNYGHLIPIVIAGVLILIGMILVLLVWKKRKEGVFREPDYRAFFIMGIIFLPLGIVFLVIYTTRDLPFAVSIPFIAMGIIYMTIGIVKRDSWR